MKPRTFFNNGKLLYATAYWYTHTKYHILHSIITSQVATFINKGHVAVPCPMGCSVAYFDRFAAFEAPYRWTFVKGGAHMRFVDSWDIHTSTKHAWTPPLTEVQDTAIRRQRCDQNTQWNNLRFLHGTVTHKIIRPTMANYFSHPKLQVWGLHKSHIMKLPGQRHRAYLWWFYLILPTNKSETIVLDGKTMPTSITCKVFHRSDATATTYFAICFVRLLFESGYY